MKSFFAIAMLYVVPYSVSYAQERSMDGAVPITGGTFLMGTDRAEIAGLKSRYQIDFPGIFENESPAHEVTVSNFRMDRFEVTNALFFEFLKAVPEWKKNRIDDNAHNGNYLADWQDGRYPDEGAELPAVSITWAAAQSYCRWRGGRLPTEAEWEYVARSGDNREFPWGDDLPSPDLANYHASGHGKPIKVGGYPPNEFGVYDLAGNVWELLLDVWVPDYPVAAQLDPVAGGPVADEHIVNIDGRRALRGASFGGSVVNLRTRWRDSHVVSNATDFVGFRCAYPENSK